MLALLGPGTAIAGAFKERYELRQHITSQYRGEPCFVDATFSISASDLLDVAADELDYSELFVTDAERSRRLCLVQAILNLNGHYQYVLDGVEGDRTRGALKALAEKRGVDNPNIRNIEMRRALVRELYDWCRRM